MQANVNCSCICTLHDGMEITNGNMQELYVVLCGIESIESNQQLAIARQLDLCYIFI
jgi:hypothetical protein